MKNSNNPYKQGLYIRSPLEKDREEICELLSKVFSKSWGYYEFFNFCKNGYLYNSHYNAETSKVGLIEDRIVTFCGVMNYRINIGSSVVKVAGVGGVATDDNYRRQGLMYLTIQESIKSMSSKGYQLSLLYGIPGYYRKFGYVTAWPADTYIIPISRFNKTKSDYKIYKLENDRDIPDIFSKLYNKQYGMLTGTAVHPTYKRNRFPGKWNIYYWKQGLEKKIAGYVITEVENRRLKCIEASGDIDEIWAVLGKMIKKEDIKEIHFPNLHYLSELAFRIRTGSYTLERIQEYDAGPMIRLINLRSTLNEIVPVLSDRLKNSTLSQWNGKLEISNGREDAMLIIDKSQVKVADDAKNISASRISGREEIVQLIIGSADPIEIVRNAGIVLTGEAVKLIEVLFPRQFPALSKWDKF